MTTRAKETSNACAEQSMLGLLSKAGRLLWTALWADALLQASHTSGLAALLNDASVHTPPLAVPPLGPAPALLFRLGGPNADWKLLKG